MIALVPIYQEPGHVLILYDLLKERTQHQSISHKELPTLEDHTRFVRSRPYFAWYLIHAADGYVGSIYLSKQREIGVFIFRSYTRKGYGQEAVEELMRMWPGRFLANVNPDNEASISFWKKMGARHIQNTYEIENG